MAKKVKKLIIIGSGPAGYTAAIYSARALLRPIVFTGWESGGQLTTTNEVENYPGFPQGIKGPELMEKFREQAGRFGAEIIDAQISRVDFSSRPFSVWAEDKEYQAQAIIIATGASAKWLGIPSEQRLRGKGVSSCATCDGFFFKGKDLVLVGGGDVAMEDAIFLTKFADKVTVLHRREQLRASKILQERAKSNPKIEFMLNTELVEALGKDGVEGARVKNNQSGQETELNIGGVFIAIGHEPNTGIFKGQLELDVKNYIVIHDGSRTSVAGGFAAGAAASRTH